jgi:hypothetical protein
MDTPNQQQQSVSWPQDQSQRPKGLQALVFTGPIPGQSWTHAPKSMPWQHPPQFPDLEEFVEFVMNNLMESHNLKQLFQLAKLGISVEEFVRVTLFTAFAEGKITPDVAMLAYKPLMLGIMAVLYRAGLKDTKVVLKKRMKNKDLDRIKMMAGIKDFANTPANQNPQLTLEGSPGSGFISNPNKE